MLKHIKQTGDFTILGEMSSVGDDDLQSYVFLSENDLSPICGKVYNRSGLKVIAVYRHSNMTEKNRGSVDDARSMTIIYISNVLDNFLLVYRYRYRMSIDIFSKA